MTTCQSSSIVVCYLFIVNDEFIIELRQLAKNVFRQQSKYVHMKNICLVGTVVDNDDYRLLDVNMVLLVLIEKILTMMEFV